MGEPVTLPGLARVAVCGGTHGNELSGLYVVREMERRRREEGDKVRTVSLTLVVSNPRAVEVCRRYVETDMNRCFTNAVLSSPVSDTTPYEVRRAQELNTLLGPKCSAQAVDLLCDLHNTTSNMGLCFICNSSTDWTILHIYKYIQSKLTDAPVRLLLIDIPLADSYSLDSMGKHGFSLEVGPQPHGVIRADIFNIMKQGVDLFLEWIDQFHSGVVFESFEVDAYVRKRSMDYPREPETRQITAAVHPQLQDRDFTLLNPGNPVFLTFSGETVRFDGEESLYPFFINECAYYEKGIAFHLAEKKTLRVPSVKVKKS
ncbi:N-acyl-aromatic-L-amino acid amidohydrolase (carboxylate-forming) B isoform X2 [Chanos chanos]|nr:N-acyl-aromatic-L-amino acid amidohydrolase (carboxylate-forming) B-like isoform X2 [Chanos chanos]XP_030643866.1 N-acyl-aromatic-L-amino acid amidohydrolase (carboxylate-forming) B-like isoform X2 [Chanos chanos]XP_030643867.1 N-acyl-aromatic-L-amino acid amidohydrolase (carboxylate-forming) B-like isoform X2 [Chanos chanos]